MKSEIARVDVGDGELRKGGRRILEGGQSCQPFGRGGRLLTLKGQGGGTVVKPWKGMERYQLLSRGLFSLRVKIGSHLLRMGLVKLLRKR